MTGGLVVLFLILILPVFWGIGAYNRLVGLRNGFKNAFAQIDVQLKRRYDLIPNLIETARAYMKHERETLEAVIAARNSAASARQAAAANPADIAAITQMTNAEGALAGTLTRFLPWPRPTPTSKPTRP